MSDERQSGEKQKGGEGQRGEGDRGLKQVSGEQRITLSETHQERLIKKEREEEREDRQAGY